MRMGPKPHLRAKALDGAQLASPPGLSLPQHRCGTAWRSQQGHSIGICGRGFSNRLFSPAASNLSSLQRKNCSELQPRQNQGRKHFKDFLLYNILHSSGLLSCRRGVLCVSQWCWARGGEEPRWQNKPMVQPTSGQKFVAHPEATDLALIIHTFLAPASGLLLLLWPFLNLLFWNTLYTLLEKLQASCWTIQFKICLAFALLAHEGAWGSPPAPGGPHRSRVGSSWGQAEPARVGVT